MGLFDFVTEAGEKLTEKVLGSTSNDDLTKTVKVSQQRIDQLRGEQISQAIAQLEIDGEQVSVDVNASVVVLSGSAPTQEALEKMVLCAGNQHGIGEVDCQLQVVPPASLTEAASPADTSSATTEATFYTVKSGDTLGKIAQKFYGAAGKYTVIFTANQPMLSDPNKIYPGQKLRIPPL